MAVKIEIEPVTIGEGGHRYRVTFAGGLLVESAREPLFDACRALATQGVTGPIEMWRPGRSHPTWWLTSSRPPA